MKFPVAFSRLLRADFITLLVICVVILSGMPAAAQMIVAHRGASHDAPENTLAAFRLAFEQQADGIEGDFRLTADGHIVCIHDADTRRVAGKRLIVAKTPLAELKQLDVGSWKDARWKDERIPTLAEVLAILPPEKRFFIELKTGPEIVAPLKKQLDQARLKPRQYVVISFDAATIARCEETIPGVVTHWLSGHKRDDSGCWQPTPAGVIETLQTVRADGFGSQAKRARFNEAFIEQLDQTGLGAFHVWTVDDVATARFYQQQRAVGITTNRPGFLRRALTSPANATPKSQADSPN